MRFQTPYFSYTDEQGQQHQVWFENADSIRAKLRTAWNIGINGLALWRLGLEDENIWNVFANEAVVKKIIRP
jgi:spore germination protein YaaH